MRWCRRQPRSSGTWAEKVRSTLRDRGRLDPGPAYWPRVSMRRVAILALAASILSGCSSSDHYGPIPVMPGPPPGLALLKYDRNHDGKVTLAELEEGLHAEFNAADKHHTGCLDAAEVRELNAKRWAANHSATPLVDWEHVGCLTFAEFAAEPLSLFEELDKNGDGVLTAKELRGRPNKPAIPRIDLPRD